MRKPVLHLAEALGHESSDKRLNILRRIGETGSISEAARSAGVSYKAAWQAIETLTNLAGVPLVLKAVGGAGGGGAALTAEGERVLEAARRMEEARAAVLASLEQEAPGAVAGLATLGLRTSMRNHLPARVQAVSAQGSQVRVVLELADGTAIASRITRESVQLLGLEPGLSVLALAKATAVRIASRIDSGPGTNVLSGRVARASRAAAGGEVSLTLEGGLQLVGFAAADHGLEVGSAAMAAVDESGVVIAVSG